MRVFLATFAVLIMAVTGCQSVPPIVSPLQSMVSDTLVKNVVPNKENTADDPATLEMDFYINDGKEENKFYGKASLYHLLILSDSKTPMKTSQQTDTYQTIGGKDTKAYTDSIPLTGASNVMLQIGLYDENGVGNIREQKLQQLTQDLAVFPPINAWSVAGIQVIKTVTIFPMIWDVIFPDKAIVPRREILIGRRELGNKIQWVLPTTELTTDTGKIVLRLKSASVQ